MWFSVQSSNLYFKWPALQLIGWTTVLISALFASAPLHLFLSGQSTGIIALCFWLCLCLYGVYAANKIHNKHLTITNDRLTRAYKFVQLSDVHAGSRSRAFVQKSIDQAASHQPDAVLITGDLLDSSAVNREFLTPLQSLNCPVFMCLGNHERYVDLKSAISAIEDNKTVILRNQSVTFKGIGLIGIDDADNTQQVARTLPDIALDHSLFNILLYHKPDGWPAAVEHGIDLMLAGHTHAGQVWPFGLLVKTQFKHVSGYFQNNSKSLYVSPGTGTWGPILRLGTRCEMTVIELIPSA